MRNRNWLTVTAATIGFLTFGAPGEAASLAAAYTFNGNLNAQESGVPALTAVNPLGTNAFGTDTVFGSTETIYSFNGNTTPSQQAGLSFDDGLSLIDPSSYSVEMVFDLANVAGYKRLVDTQDRLSDNGLYNLNGTIDLYNTADGTSNVLTANTYADLIYTDDGTTVDAYLNGVLQFSDNDSQLNLNNTNNPGQLLNLFLDNLGGGGTGEYSSGNIALFEAFDGVLSQSDVTTLSANPFANVPALSSSTPEPSTDAMLLGGLALLALPGFRRSRKN